MRGIARLAQELGISTGTVSRALNGKPDVNELTRRRVLEAAQRLGYAAQSCCPHACHRPDPVRRVHDRTRTGKHHQHRLLFHGRVRRRAARPSRTRSRSSRPALCQQPGPLHLSPALRLARCRGRHDPGGDTQGGPPHRIAAVGAISRSSRSGAATPAAGYSWIDLDFEGCCRYSDRSARGTRTSAHCRHRSLWRGQFRRHLQAILPRQSRATWHRLRSRPRLRHPPTGRRRAIRTTRSTESTAPSGATPVPKTGGQGRN